MQTLVTSRRQFFIACTAVFAAIVAIAQALLVSKGAELKPKAADALWAIGRPIRCVSGTTDTTITNPHPELMRILNECRMSRGKTMFPTLRFFAA